MNPAKKRAVIAAAVMAIIEGVFLTSPDLGTEVVAAIFAFAVTVGVLFICLRLLPVTTWSLVKQRIFTWLVAAGTGASACLLPRVL
jgi:hypothetical protein